MTVIHVVLPSNKVRIAMDDDIVIDVREGAINIHHRPKNWRPPRGERVEVQRDGNLYTLPLLILNPEPDPNGAA